MDQDPRLELETKAAETPTLEEVRRRSVQDRAEGEARTPFGRGVSYWLTWPATDAEAIPEWPNSARDAKLRDWWWRIPLLSAVVTTFVSRISTLPIKVEADDEDDAAYWKWVLTNADFGRGWKTCIGKFTLDLLTQDNGAYLEVIRPARVRGAKGLMPVHRLGPDTYAVRTPGGDYVRLGKLSAKAVTDDPWDTPIGVAHLDSGKCSRQLDPETPVVYSSKKGPRPLKFYQVFDASWMTSSREDDANYGMCPVTLCQVAARIAKNIDTYVDEKVGGRYFKRIIWATNVFQEALEQAVKDAEAQADARGQTRYVRNIVVGAADVTSPGEVGTLDLSGLPDGFDRETEYDIAADLVTACFGLDRPEVIPMRTATLGQAGQVGVMALKAKGKGVAEIIALIERFLAQWVLPQDGSVQATLDFTDDEEDARRAQVQKDKAATVANVCGTPTADGTPPYTRTEVRALHEYYELIPEKMLEPEEKEETPAVEEEGGKKATKGGPGSGWFAPPKGTHTGEAAGLGRKLQYKPSNDVVKHAEWYTQEDISYTAEKFGLSEEDVIAEIEKRLEEDLARPLAIRRGLRGAMGAATEGRFKTQFETGTSGGTFNPDKRREAENRGLGIPTDLPNAQRPVYAYFRTEQHRATGYGSVEFVLKDSVKERTTYTLGDSLFHFGTRKLAGGTNSQDMAAWDRSVYDYFRAKRPSLGVSYVEAQIQGGVQLSDVSKVVIHSSFGRRDYEDLIDTLTTKGVKVEVTGADVVF